MKVSMTCTDLSRNSLLRVYPFAKVIGEEHEVEVVGPVKKLGIYPPVRNDKDVKYVSLPTRTVFPFYLKTLRDVKSKLDGDIIHAFKPTFQSFLPALMKKKKVVLDIDDWESQYVVDAFLSANPLDVAKFCLVDAYVPESYFVKKIIEKQIAKANAVITSSKTLQRKFGGTWIPTGPSTEYFNPENFNGKKIREEFGLQGKKVVLFMGRPKLHKGMGELVSAIQKLRERDESVHLLIVGAGKDVPYGLMKYLKKGKDSTYVNNLSSKDGVTVEGYRDHKEMPEFLAAADVVCVPHRNTLSANAQLPIKIFEPMAMQKPVVTTNTTDMKEIFAGCGTVVRPDSVQSLVEGIREYVEDKELRLKHGRKARKECVEKYSWKIMKRKTEAVYESL